MVREYEFLVNALTVLSPESWVSALRLARAQGLSTNRYGEDLGDLPIELQYVLRSVSRCGYPGFDLRAMVRLAIEACCPGDEVVYDLTDLIAGGCFEADEDMVAYAEYHINREHEINRRIIVLTEGSSDKWILERSLALFYPHLAPFFSFMDFEGTRCRAELRY